MIEWRTSAVCVSQQRSTTPIIPIIPTVMTTPSNKVAESSPQSGLSTGSIVAVMLAISASIGVAVLVGMYYHKVERFFGPNSRLTRWIYSPSHAQVHYSRVASADEASHLLQSQPELEWDSDEELLKV